MITPEQVDAAYIKGRLDGMKDGDKCTEGSIRVAYEAGFNDAIEKAAKVVEQYGCSDCDHYCDHADYDALPSVIRQLKPEVK
jgi:Uri superfamily endonuclease